MERQGFLAPLSLITYHFSFFTYHLAKSVGGNTADVVLKGILLQGTRLDS